MTPPTDVNAYYEGYIQEKNPAFKPLVDALRARVREWVPDVRETVNAWGVCTFETSHGEFGYFMVNKGHVTFGIVRGGQLNDPHQLLQGVGKNMRHVKIKKIEDLDRVGLRELVLAAVQLNRDEPVKGMGKGKS